VNVPCFDLPSQIRSIRPELDAAIARTLDSCAFCLGPEVVRFEGAFAAFVGTPHCLGFNSGTSALHVAMRILDIGPGDEVITTPYTFVATTWAIAYVGARPVYVDVDRETMNLDPRLIERAITPRTRAVMPVDLYGHPYDADPIQEICRRHKLPLVEDAAQAVGARYKGRSAGTLGEMAAFSFYPGKNLGACGEGGALVTASDAQAKRAAALREHLQSKGVGTALHYPLPLHLQKCFADLGYKAGDFPVAEAAARECLSIPMYPELTDPQVEYVAAMIREFPSW
jgi:dTDP-4-amino-4,6-dideoxygalactose transaminase